MHNSAVNDQQNKSARDPKWVLGALAGAAGLVAAQPAQASPSGVTGLGLPVDSSHSQTIDFDGDGTSDLGVVVSGSSLSTSKSGAEQDTGVATDPTTANVTALSLGDTIDGSLNYNYAAFPELGFPITASSNLFTNDGTDPTTGNFTIAAGQKYIGVQLNLADGIHYGWVSFQTTDQDVGNLAGIIDGYGYETDVNTAISAGATPEPSSLALLAIGAAGIASYRGRRYR
jgi:hypothetical protein